MTPSTRGGCTVVRHPQYGFGTCGIAVYPHLGITSVIGIRKDDLSHAKSGFPQRE